MESTLEAAEAVARETGDVVKALVCLRALTLEDFAAFFLDLPNPRFPALSALLPRMAAPKVQKSWTGADGEVLLKQTLCFVRLVRDHFHGIMGRPLNGQSILDFGCGWGRIIRLLYYFSDPSLIYGCDPWDKSLEICHADSVLGHLALSDYLPRSLPFETPPFDLIVAFSVFTHLSERAAAAAMNVLAGGLSECGMLVVTIRPFDYWWICKGLSAPDRAKLEATHAANGFAFLAHSRQRVDGDITYGDTTMTPEYLERRFPWVELRRIERTREDPYQVVLFITKKLDVK